MNMPTNLLAWTDEGESYPEYISVNAEGGKVEVTVRGAARGDRPGVTVTIPLGFKQWEAMVAKMVLEINRMKQRAVV